MGIVHLFETFSSLIFRDTYIIIKFELDYLDENESRRVWKQFGVKFSISLK